MSSEKKATRSDAFYTPQQMAALLMVSQRIVQEMLDRGEIVGFKVGKLWRTRVPDFEAFVAKRIAERGPTQ